MKRMVPFVLLGIWLFSGAACGSEGGATAADTADVADELDGADTSAEDTLADDTSVDVDPDTAADTVAALVEPPPLVAPEPQSPGGVDLAVQPAVAVGADGRVLVAWSGRNDGALGIHRALLAADGEVVAEAAPVNTDTRGIQNEPAVCALFGGGYVIVWSVDTQETGPDGENLEVRFRRYDADGGAVDSAGQRVYTSVVGNHWLGDVGCAPSGGFVVAGVRPGDGPGFSVFFQRYDDAGAVDGDAVTALAATEGGQAFPAVAVDADGAVLVAWEDAATSQADTRLVWRRFPADGASPSEVKELAAAAGVDASGASVSAAADGALALAGNLNTTLQLRWLSSHDGEAAPISTPDASNVITSQAVLTPLGGGRFAALWFAGSGSAVAARLGYFDGDGFSGDVTLSTGSFPLGYRPAIAYADGVLAAAWTESLGGGAYAVRLALLTAPE